MTLKESYFESDKYPGLPGVFAYLERFDYPAAGLKQGNEAD